MSTTELENLAEALVKATKEYQELLSAIKNQDPELFQSFEQAKEKCEGLESAVKAMLKDNPNSEVVVDSHKFRVSSSTKLDIDLESTVLKAEGYGHLEVLLEYGVLSFSADPSKVARLPEELKPIYEKFVSSKTAHRISIPKGLKRSW